MRFWVLILIFDLTIFSPSLKGPDPHPENAIFHVDSRAAHPVTHCTFILQILERGTRKQGGYLVAYPAIPSCSCGIRTDHDPS